MRTMRMPAAALASVLTLGVAGPLAGQQQDTAAAQIASELVFEREVFDYPTFERRNPFVALLSATDGPRFEQMRLQGIIFRGDGDRSVAIIGRTTGGQSQRLRVGESWGNVRVLEIARTEILVEVEEFGAVEQRVMTLPTRGQGGS